MNGLMIFLTVTLIWWLSVGTNYFFSERRTMINECERSLSLEESCKLIAVPNVRSGKNG